MTQADLEAKCKILLGKLYNNAKGTKMGHRVETVVPVKLSSVVHDPDDFLPHINDLLARVTYISGTHILTKSVADFHSTYSLDSEQF